MNYGMSAIHGPAGLIDHLKEIGAITETPKLIQAFGIYSDPPVFLDYSKCDAEDIQTRAAQYSNKNLFPLSLQYWPISLTSDEDGDTINWDAQYVCNDDPAWYISRAVPDMELRYTAHEEGDDEIYEGVVLNGEFFGTKTPCEETEL